MERWIIRTQHITETQLGSESSGKKQRGEIVLAWAYAEKKFGKY